jgi:hypothetical protein
MILRHKRVVGAPEIGLQCDDCLGGHLLNLQFYYLNILAFALKPLVNIGQKLFASIGCHISEVVASKPKLVRVLVQVVIGQVHE